MMANAFFLKLLLSFLIGGLWVILTTVIADKLGTKIGGLISGLPSTLLFGLFFIGWTQSPQVAAQATTVVPIINGISCILLLSYIFLLKKRSVWISIAGALSIWSVLSFMFILLNFNNFLLSIIIYILLLLIAYFIVEHKLKVKSMKGKKIKYTPLIIIVRGLLSGFIVFVSVLMAKIGGPILGGMFSMFPAVFTSTLLITYFSQGPKFSSAIAKSSMISAISIVVYSIAVRYSYPYFGIMIGTFISVSTSFLTGYLIYNYFIKKIS